MVQVDQHHVISAIGSGVVKSDRANVLGVGMLQSLGTRRPTMLQGGQGEDLLARMIRAGNQGRLLGQRQTDFHHLADILRRQSKFPLRLPILIEQFIDLLCQVPLELEHLPHGFGLGIGSADARHRVATTEHGLFDIFGQHRAVAAQVFTDRLNLLRHTHQEL